MIASNGLRHIPVRVMCTLLPLRVIRSLAVGHTKQLQFPDNIAEEPSLKDTLSSILLSVMLSKRIVSAATPPNSCLN